MRTGEIIWNHIQRQDLEGTLHIKNSWKRQDHWDLTKLKLIMKKTWLGSNHSSLIAINTGNIVITMKTNMFMKKNKRITMITTTIMRTILNMMNRKRMVMKMVMGYKRKNKMRMNNNTLIRMIQSEIFRPVIMWSMMRENKSKIIVILTCILFIMKSRNRKMNLNIMIERNRLLYIIISIPSS